MMFRLVALMLLGLLPACSSVPQPGPQAAALGQPPPDCSKIEPGTQEHQKCLEDKAPASKGVTTAVLAGTMVAIAAGAAVMALSDENAKTDIVRVGTLDNGLPLYRFRYRGAEQQFVGVMAQDVQAALPDAVSRQPDGYLQVDYGKLGARPMTWEAWQTGGYVYPRNYQTAAVSIAVAR